MDKYGPKKEEFVAMSDKELIDAIEEMRKNIIERYNTYAKNTIRLQVEYINMAKQEQKKRKEQKETIEGEE